MPVILLAVSVIVAAAGTSFPRSQLLFSDAHGPARMLDRIQGSVPLAEMLPTFTEEDWPFPWWNEAHTQAVIRGRTGLLDRFDPERLRAVDYGIWRRLTPADWIDAGRLDLAPTLTPAAGGATTLAAPLMLPPGEYDLEVAFAAGRLGGELAVMLGASPIARIAPPLPNPTRVRFTAPAPASWTVRLTDPAAARLAREMTLTPRTIVPAANRPDFVATAIEPLPSRSGAYLVYVDDDTYPEGGVFWTRDRARGDVWLKTAGATALDLILHVGAAGTAHATVGDRSVDMTLNAGETRPISVEIPTGAEWTPVTVQCSTSFRPVDTDPASTDRRVLGCQARFELR